MTKVMTEVSHPARVEGRTAVIGSCCCLPYLRKKCRSTLPGQHCHIP